MEGLKERKDCRYKGVSYSDGTELCVEYKCLLCYRGNWKETVQGPHLQG